MSAFFCNYCHRKITGRMAGEGKHVYHVDEDAFGNKANQQESCWRMAGMDKQQSGYCRYCHILVAPHDPDRVQVGDSVYHNKCIIKEMDRLLTTGIGAA